VGAMVNSRGKGTLLRNTFKNNSAQVSGAVLNSKGTMNVYSCTFESNRATSINSGAIQNFSGTLTIKNSIFTSNSGPQAGAVLNDTGTLKVYTCTFTYNKATCNKGGAIYSSGLLILDGSKFVKNAASQWGGGLHNVKSTSKISNCTFSGNIATNGGAISTSRGNIIISATKFINNTAKVDPKVHNYFGTVKYI
jgi:predicted outer membrane repeat protein